MITELSVKPVMIDDDDNPTVTSFATVWKKRSDTPNSAIFARTDPVTAVPSIVTLQQTFPTVTKNDRGTKRTYVRIASEVSALTGAIDSNGVAMRALRPVTLELIVRSPGSSNHADLFNMLKHLAGMVSQESIASTLFNEQSL